MKWPVTVAAGALVAVVLSAQDPPPGITRTALRDGVVRFDRTSTAQPAYWWQQLLELGWKPVKGLPFRRSVALLTGVSRYESLLPHELDFVETDVTDLRNFLLTGGGFDTVLEARNATVTRSLIEHYMANVFAEDGPILNSEDRLLFYYSGHGADRAGKIGYLQFSKAKDNEFSGDYILQVRDFQEWAQVNVAKHLLVVLDSCASGLAIKPMGGAGSEAVLKSLSGEGSGRLLTAGYGKQKVFGVEGSKGYSVLTHALIGALRRGGADSGNTGFVTIDQAYGDIQTEAGNFNAGGTKMNPQLGDLPRGDRAADGTFVFLNRNARAPSIPPQYSAVLAPVAKGPSAEINADATRLELARLAYEGIKDSNDPAVLKTFAEEYQDVRGAATLVAIVRGRIGIIEGPPKTGGEPTPGVTRKNPRDGLPYVWIPLGDFMMGCSKDATGKDDPECWEDEKPAHNVRISRGFWIGQTEVTVAAYEKFRQDQNKPALPTEDSDGRKINTAAGNPNLPAVAVTWQEAQDYCEWAGSLRLPWEAEWEYAARAGDTRPRYGELDAIAWYGDNSGRGHINSIQWWNEDQSKYNERLFKNGNGPHPVAERSNSQNRWKLYDTLGNVWEWVSDWYDEKYYAQKVSPDPHGPGAGKERVLRGGSWNSYPRSVRVSYRYRNEPAYRDSNIGFRCAGELR
jgi:formylglycine-generating enzyme required for sulfatase activity